MNYALLHGDNRELLPFIPDGVIDAMVTDPPAGIEFMGRDWDCFRRAHNPNDAGRPSVFGRTSRHAPHSYGESDRGHFIAFMTSIMRECWRTMKPGAHALVWAIPRTSHWTAMALEDAGFEVRDVIHHLFGQGMPKSKNLGGGVGTALKPACEHWLLVRKPVSGSITATYARHGTGGLNIDACRVERAAEDVPGWHKSGADGSAGFQGETFQIRAMAAEEVQERCGDKGRWPPNVVLSEDVAPLLDEQSGWSKSDSRTRNGSQGRKAKSIAQAGGAMSDPAFTGYGDAGGASRYFPCFGYFPKPSRGEREAGLDALDAAILNRVNPGGLEREPRFAPIEVKNNHPTVKSIALCRWLCTLICPAGGMILDPFMGSGTTGCAAVLNGQRFLGMEQDARYHEIAELRIAHWHASVYSEPPSSP